MIRHIVMFNWKEGTEASVIEEVGNGFAHMRDTIPNVVNMVWGPDQGLADANFDYAMIADFENAEDWKAYQVHPEHVGFFQRFGQHAAAAARVQLKI